MNHRIKKTTITLASLFCAIIAWLTITGKTGCSYASYLESRWTKADLSTKAQLEKHIIGYALKEIQPENSLLGNDCRLKDGERVMRYDILWNINCPLDVIYGKDDRIVRALFKSKKLPMAGEVFKVRGNLAFLILPSGTTAINGMPWVWYAPTLPGMPGPEERWMFKKFMAAGIAVAGIDVGESFGSPEGRDLFSSFYDELVFNRGLSRTPCLLARSRGGLMLYNWAVEHPSCVACIAGIYPVCNLNSYPGLKNACGAYSMTEEQLHATLAEHNPIERIGPLASAHVPIYHIHGDVDTLVPLVNNSGELAQRYQELGGEMTLNVVKGQGHNMWPGWFQCQELVDFVIAHACNGGPDKPGDSNEK